MTNLIFNSLSLNRLLKKNYVDDTFHSSHVSMIEPRGKFRFSRKDLDKLYDLVHNEKHGIAEKPGSYTALYFDFDIKHPIENCKEFIHKNGRFYDQDYVNDIINKINNKLKPRIKNYDDKHLICCLLEKDIYKKNDKFMSGGFHLHYPNIFLKDDIKDTLMKELKNIFGDRFDAGMSHVPWLLYNGVKGINLESYKLTKIFDVDLNEMTMIDTFSNYKIFDTDENLIPINPENILKLLPRILSINPTHREICEFKTPPEPHEIVEPIVRNKKDFPKNIQLDRERLKNSLPHLKSHNNDYVTWSKVMSVCKSLYHEDDGYDIFNEWSQGADSYDDANNKILWDKCTMNDCTFGVIVNIFKSLGLYESVRNQIYKSKILEKEYSLYDVIFKSEKECSEFVYNFIKDDAYFTKSHGWIIFNSETGLWEFDYSDTFMVSYITDLLCPILDKHHTQLTSQINDIKHKYKMCDDEAEKLNIKNQKKALEKTLKILDKQIIKCGSFNHVSNIMKFLKSACNKNNNFIKEFESIPELFAFSDGTCIDVTTGIRRKIEKTDKILYALSYPYPERDQSDITPVNDLLLSIFNSQERVDEYLNLKSLSLYGLNKNEIFVIHIGQGRNGKGVVDKLDQITFDCYYSPISNNILCKSETEYNAGDNSEIKGLEFKRLVVASEPDKNSRFKTDIIKKISGNDSISCKNMGKNKCSYVPKYHIHNLLNCLPEFTHRDNSLDKRIVVLMYKNEFVDNPTEDYERQIDTNLKRNITNITFNKSFRNGYLHLLLDSYYKTKGYYTKSELTLENTKEFMKKQNPLISWFEKEYQNDDTTKGIQSSVLFEIYKNNYNSDKKMTQTMFGKYLKELCRCKKDGDGNIRFLCIKKEITYLENHNIPDM